MLRDKDHLKLPIWQEALERRKRPGGRPPERNAKKHGKKLLAESKAISNRLKERVENYPSTINPKLIFKLKLHRNGSLDEDKLAQIGLQVLARDADKAIVVFPNEPALSKLERRLSEYSGLTQGNAYAYLSAIEELVELGPEDRIGKRLLMDPFMEDELAALDVELWHSGSRDECLEKINEVRNFLSEFGLNLLDWFVGANLCILRAQLNYVALQTLLDTDYIKEIDRRPRPSFEMVEITRAGFENLEIAETDIGNLVGILILDSGVMQGHPLLSPVLGDAQVFPDTLKQRIIGGAEDGDLLHGGHGTAVAGVAIYGDLGEEFASGEFAPKTQLFSARITDDNNEYDQDELLEHQLENAVSYFTENYPQIKVINISLGDDRLICSDKGYQFRFAAAIDELAYKFRDKELLFVVSAGNWLPTDLSDEDILRNYPKYLLSRPEVSRIVDPATASIPITVGGLSYGSGTTVTIERQQSTDRLVGGVRGYPSPFTRTGPGFDGAIKPELVDYAGDIRIEQGQIRDRQPAYAGLPTTNKAFGPPSGSLFRTVSGTSFAAPKVASIAAQIFEEFPDASSNLVRALIAAGAKIPAERPNHFVRKKPWDIDVLNVYGYGQPDLERSILSSSNDVLMLFDGAINVDTFMLFEIPELPAEFLSKPGTGFISSVLAFDPPTRHTRADSYFGITMEFALYRNVEAKSLADALRAWERKEIEDLEDELGVPVLERLQSEIGVPIKVDLKPGVKKRKKGTLQRGFFEVSRDSWQYNGEPLVLAVVCQRKWAPATIESQRFAIITSISHQNAEVDLHAHFLQRTEVHEKIRIRF